MSVSHAPLPARGHVLQGPCSPLENLLWMPIAPEFPTQTVCAHFQACVASSQQGNPCCWWTHPVPEEFPEGGSLLQGWRGGRVWPRAQTSSWTVRPYVHGSLQCRRLGLEARGGVGNSPKLPCSSIYIQQFSDFITKYMQEINSQYIICMRAC